MTRLTVEYTKAGLMGLIALIGLIAVIVGGSSPAMIAIPVVLAALAIFFWWRADNYYREK